MIKYSKTKKAVNITSRNSNIEVLDKNKIFLYKLIDFNLKSKNIFKDGKNILLDTSEYNSNNFLTKKISTSLFIPQEKQNFETGNTDTINNNNNKHEPLYSFISKAAAKYYQIDPISDLTKAISRLRFLSRIDEYCDDHTLENYKTIFEITASRPTVLEVEPPINSLITKNNQKVITDNILLTNKDIINKNLKNVVGLPKNIGTFLYNKETDLNNKEVKNPKIDFYVNSLTDKSIKESDNFIKYEASSTFIFEPESRTSNIIQINKDMASMFSIYGIVSVKPKEEFIDEIENVTVYIEVPKKYVLLNEAKKLSDSDWFVAGFKTIQCFEYGMPVSISTFLHRNAIVRLRTNLDTTMGSMNFFEVRNYGGFTNHYSNTFYGFYGLAN